MLKNYFVLKELTRNLAKELAGFYIREIFSQEKNKLIIFFSDDKETTKKYLEFSCESILPYLILKDKFSKAKKNTVNLFNEIYDSKIETVGLFQDDRIIEFKLTGGFNLYFLFITGKFNFMVIKNNIIIDSFKKRNLLIDKTLSEVLKTKQTQSIDLKEPGNVKDFLKTNFVKYGSLYFKESLYNLNLNENDLINEANKKLLEKEFARITNSFESPEYILYKRNSDIIFSLSMLTHLRGYEIKRHENINKLLNDYIISTYKERKKKTIKDNRLNELKKRIVKTESKITSLQKQLEMSKQSEKYFKYGEFILANLNKTKKGDRELTIVSEDTGDSITVKLNETLTPSDNAQKYFKKYKRQKDSVKLLNEKIELMKKEKSKLEKNLIDLKETQDFKALAKMDKREKVREKKDKETSMFRKFVLNDNYEVWVGKDSRSNDLLTMKYSAQNDLWFHIRGASGSHTVLKIASKKKVVDKNIIQTAASIAAYYSKARNASNVPVAYCERKHVKKKKGFKQGSVVMSREKVVFVKPMLPEQN